MSDPPEPWRVDRRRRSSRPGANQTPERDRSPTPPQQPDPPEEEGERPLEEKPESYLPPRKPTPPEADTPALAPDEWPVTERHMEYLLIGTGILYVLLLFDVYYNGFISSMDAVFIDAVVRLPDAFRALLGALFSFPGGRWLLAVVVLAAALHSWLRGGRAAAGLMAASALVFMLFIEFTKWIVGRPRPTTFFAGTDWMPEWFYSTSMAFPSGHSAAPVFVYGVVLVAFLGPGQTRESLLPIPSELPRRYLLIGLALAFLPGVGRILWGLHWLSDVIAGWSLGIAWLCATLLLAIYWQRSTGAEWSPDEAELEPPEWAHDDR